MVNTTCHALFSGLPLRKRSDMTLVGVSQRASPSCQVIYGFAYLWKWIVCACFLCIYWCWIKFCPSPVKMDLRKIGVNTTKHHTILESCLINACFVYFYRWVWFVPGTSLTMYCSGTYGKLITCREDQKARTLPGRHQAGRNWASNAHIRCNVP